MRWTFLFILLAHWETAAGKDTQEPAQPVHMTEYLQARDRCTFKPAKKIRGGDINIDICEVEAELAEGSGYYRFTRLGPFTTTGGAQRIKCVGRLDEFGAPPGTYMTRGMATAVEPMSGEFLSFPPIHLHHARMFEGSAYLPPIPPEMLDRMPWIIDGIAGAASSEECLRAVGGTSCYNIMVPPGHAMKHYTNDTFGDYTAFTEDVRKMGSPPISTVIEFGSFILTKPNPALPPPKHSIPAKFSVSDNGPAKTYAVPYNSENYRVGTFHLAFKMEMTPFKIHQHGSEGDEVWTIRGTQEDLGVPEDLRSPIAIGTIDDAHTGQVIRHHPVDLPESEPLDMWKAKFEESMAKAGAAWESRTKSTATATGNKNSYNSKSQSSYFVPFDENDPPPMRGKPEILCRYYSLVEHVTPDSIAADKAEFQHVMTKGGYQHFTSEDAPFSRVEQRNEPFPKFKPNHDPVGPDGYVLPGKVNENRASPKIVSEHEQYQNLFEGVLPGKYYRHPRSALLEGESKYTQCGTVVFEAGDYFTLIGFNARRTNPEYDSSEFYGMPLKYQHTAYVAHVHLPDVPWFN